jgi:hypothetical protein
MLPVLFMYGLLSHPRFPIFVPVLAPTYHHLSLCLCALHEIEYRSFIMLVCAIQKRVVSGTLWDGHKRPCHVPHPMEHRCLSHRPHRQKAKVRKTNSQSRANDTKGNNLPPMTKSETTMFSNPPYNQTPDYSTPSERTLNKINVLTHRCIIHILPRNSSHTWQ